MGGKLPPVARAWLKARAHPAPRVSVGVSKSCGSSRRFHLKKQLIALLAVLPALAGAENAAVRNGQHAADPAPPSGAQSGGSVAGVAATAPNAPAAPMAPVATTSVAATTPEAIAAQTGFHMGAEVDESVGTGTFVDPRLY